jgi:hypothetical protein
MIRLTIGMLMKDCNRNANLLICFPPETLIKRQATQHDCPSVVLGDGDKGSGEEKIFCVRPTRAAKARQNIKISYTSTTSPINQPVEGFLSFVLLESPFVTVSMASRGHPTLVSLVAPITIFPLSLSHPADGRTCLCWLTSIANLRRLQRVTFYKNFILWYKLNYLVI